MKSLFFVAVGIFAGGGTRQHRYGWSLDQKSHPRTRDLVVIKGHIW